MFPTKKTLAACSMILWLAGCATIQKNTTTVSLVPSTPTPGPTFTTIPTQAVFTEAVTMAFVGDIMMGGSAAYKLKTAGPDSFFKDTAPYLKEVDLAGGNLEGPLGLEGKTWVRKKYTFLINPACAQGLARAGFKFMTLANNHTMDFGVKALKSTLAALEQNGLIHAGAGMNLEEARKPAWFRIKGRKIAILAYSLTQPTEFWARSERPGCAPAFERYMKEDIRSAKDNGADLVFVVCHWGHEKQTSLLYGQTNLAHLAIDSGADGVIGAHPHIWQGLEVYQGKPIAYSIGNFAFGSYTSNKDSGILELVYDPKDHWSGGKIIPLNVHNSEVQFCPALMKPTQAGKFHDYLVKLSSNVDLSYSDTAFDWKATPWVASTQTPTPTSTASPTATSIVPLSTISSAGSMTLTRTPTVVVTPNPLGSVPGVVNP